MATITEDYVSFEMAKLLKEKGFDEPTIGTYNIESKNPILIEIPIRAIHCEAVISAPTLQMAMKWLREVHNLHIDVDPSEGDWNPTVLELENWSCVVKFGDEIPIQDSYEEAVEEAIKYCIENLI